MFIKRIGSHDLPIPKRATEGSAGMDLQSASERPIDILPGMRAMVTSGWSMAIPANCVGLIWPRSGLAVKHGVDVLAGCIDSDYFGELLVVLINHGTAPFRVNYGDRVAQLLVLPCVMGYASESFDDECGSLSARGNGKFGSTGV